MAPASAVKGECFTLKDREDDARGLDDDEEDEDEEYDDEEKGDIKPKSNGKPFANVLLLGHAVFHKFPK